MLLQGNIDSRYNQFITVKLFAMHDIFGHVSIHLLIHTCILVI